MSDWSSRTETGPSRSSARRRRVGLSSIDYLLKAVSRGPSVEAYPNRSTSRATLTPSAARLTRSAANAELALFYTDASALVKLVIDEPESEALRAYLADAELVSCELVLTEIPRAIRRAASFDPDLPLDLLMERAGELIDAVALRPLDRGILAAAGALAEPVLRALDAVHIAAAVDVFPFDAFVSYDERQTAAARLAGLRTVGLGG